MVEQSGVHSFQMLKNDELDRVSTKDFDKVLISPGPGIAKEAGDLLSFVSHFHSSKDFLGICLGFEAIGEFFGASLKALPGPMHGIKNMGQVVGEDALFNTLPPSFSIGHYHSWYFPEDDLPSELKVSMRDQNGIVMAFKHENYALRGLQFHPESVMTDHGLQIIKNWLKL